jgi:hypothetical protein
MQICESRSEKPFSIRFAGSGTTLLAAKLLGLNYIGFEIDPDTYQIACQRLEQQPLDLRQFCEVEADPQTYSPAHICTEDPGGPFRRMHTDDPGREEIQERRSGNVTRMGRQAIRSKWSFRTPYYEIHTCGTYWYGKLESFSLKW